MDYRFDAFSKLVSSASRRRDVFRSLGALAIGALGIHAAGVDNDAEAKQKNKRCKNCKQKCRRKNRRKNHKNKKNCNNKCHNKCH